MRYVTALTVLLWFGAAQAAEPEASPPFKVGMAGRAYMSGACDWRQGIGDADLVPSRCGCTGEAEDIRPPGRRSTIMRSTAPRCQARHCRGCGRATSPRSSTDSMLKDPTFGPRIDPQQIGAAGHSAGGYTVIELAGGITSRAHFRAACAAREPDRQCAPPPEFPDLVAQVGAMAESDPAYRMAGEEVRSYRDSRVRAVFAMAPGLAGAFLPDSLAHIEIPVAIVAGAADEVVPVKSNAGFFAARIPHAQLTILPAPTSHMVPTDLCLEAGREALSCVCNDQPGVDRAAVEAKTADLAQAFFGFSAR